MQFTDLLFLFTFLPILLLLYYIFKEKYRCLILLLFSLFFYSCGSIRYLLLLIITMLVNIVIGKAIIFCKKGGDSAKALTKLLLIIGIACDIGILGYYKYFDFAVTGVNQLFGSQIGIRNLLLPLGLSFYTFKEISFLIDVYKGQIQQFSIMKAATYFSFFGQIQSGPIARFDELEIASLIRTDRQSLFTDGVVRFMVGFSKKILLANVLGNIVIEVFDNTLQLSTPLAWLGSICYSLQLYYDFSGYSDMAVGICYMLGYKCPENFNYPYATRSISEFWRRWHITLGLWFRDYVYIPMGGSRVKKSRLYINLFVVWLLTGLWHGANWTFIAWGLGYFVLIAFEKATGFPQRFKHKASKVLWRIFTLLVVNFQWVMFRSESLTSGMSFIKTMCSNQVFEASTERALFLMGDYAVYIIAAIVLSIPLIPAIERNINNKKGYAAVYRALYSVLVSALFIMSLSFVVSGQNSPFLYANF